MDDVPLGANVLSLYQLELIKEGDHNFQVFARQEVKNVESMSNRVKMRTVSTKCSCEGGQTQLSRIGIGTLILVKEK